MPWQNSRDSDDQKDTKVVWETGLVAVITLLVESGGERVLERFLR